MRKPLRLSLSQNLSARIVNNLQQFASQLAMGASQFFEFRLWRPYGALNIGFYHYKDAACYGACFGRQNLMAAFRRPVRAEIFVEIPPQKSKPRQGRHILELEMAHIN
jgi:hypothetical protein